ncbi:MAG TPA: hypothetical protein VEU96_18955 [Bryobacteraceae bacterium]|nr:hypothetical protein [Bryobacteraceae bacterium]
MSSLNEIEALFHEALALPASVDRTAWLEARCRDNGMLREVRSLLDAYAAMNAKQSPDDHP